MTEQVLGLLARRRKLVSEIDHQMKNATKALLSHRRQEQNYDLGLATEDAVCLTKDNLRTASMQQWVAWLEYSKAIDEVNRMIYDLAKEYPEDFED